MKRRNFFTMLLAAVGVGRLPDASTQLTIYPTEDAAWKASNEMLAEMRKLLQVNIEKAVILKRIDQNTKPRKP